MKETKNKMPFKNFWLPLFIFAVALIIFYKTIDRFPDVLAAITEFLGMLTPLIIGIIFAFLLYKPVSKLENFLSGRKNKLVSRFSRGISVLTSYIVLFAVITAVLYFIIPAIVTSVGNLVKNIPGYYESTIKYVNGIAGEDGKIFGFDISGIKDIFSVEKILSYFSFDRVTQYAGEIFKATGAIIDFFMAIVISVYLLLSREHFISVCGQLLKIVLPSEKLNGIKLFVERSCAVFYNYLYAQMLDALVVAVLCTIAFSIIKMPYSLLLGVLMGLCNIIPYFGAIIGGFVVVLITLVSTGDFVKAIIALVLVIVVQQIDANILQPRIMAESVGIRPLYVLIAIMIGGGIFGFFGILFSVPCMAIIRMFVLDYINIKSKNNKLKEKTTTNDE